MSKRLILSVTVALWACAGTLVEAQAGNTPVGRWSMTFYNDATPNMTPMATQTLCFLPAGTWVGSFPGWAGRWFQKGVAAAGNGDRVRVTGNYANGVGNDSAELDFNNVNNMTGAWSEWRDNFTFLVWTRVVLTRINTACTTPLTDGASSEAVIDDGTNAAERSYAAPPTCPVADPLPLPSK